MKNDNTSIWIGYLKCNASISYFATLVLCLFFTLPIDISAAVKSSPGNISIVGTQKHFDTLSEALQSVKDGDTIELNGNIYKGNFVISKSITLMGAAIGDTLPVLDGRGSGTVVTIAADNVVIDNLEIRNSGHKSTYKTIWGDAGVLVDADNTMLRRLKIVNNDWGVVMHGGKGSLIAASLIEDNARDGIKVMGGKDHYIRGNTINRNSIGISIDALYGDHREVIVPRIDDRVALKQFASMIKSAIYSRDIMVEENDIRGNGNYGILLNKTEVISLVRNQVYKTGYERAIDEAEIEFWRRLSKSAGAWMHFPEEWLGTGIMITCWSKNNLVDSNHIHDNVAFGIGLDISPYNRIAENRVKRNKIGIYLSAANDNQLTQNIVTENVKYGIIIKAGASLIPSSGNLLTFNDLSENGINAYDSSSQSISDKEIVQLLKKMPMPNAITKDARFRQQFIGSQRKLLKPGTNRWDDGKLGNHYDNFDEATEGFIDRNSDGIGEEAYPIPGGSTVDHFPLSVDRVRKDR